MTRRAGFFTIVFTMILTTAGTAQWLPQRNGLPADHSGGAWAIDACDAMHAVVSAWNGLFLTTNGGALWRELVIPSAVMNDVVDVTMPDSAHIWVCHAPGQIDASSDGGGTWTRQYRDSTATGAMDYIRCFDMLHGVAMGDAVSAGDLNSISMINESTGWAAGWSVYKQGHMQPELLRTTDGGAHWEKQPDPASAGNYTLVSFRDAFVGFLSDRSYVYKTTDGGTSWTKSTSPEGLSRLQFVDANTGWGIGAWNSRLYKTTDNGGSWKAQPNDTIAHGGVYFLNANTGIAVGEHGSISKTTDGGITWNTFFYDQATFIYDVTFADATSGWAVGTGGYIVHTTNGGVSWTAQLGGTGFSLASVTFRDPMNGLICGSNGTILRTTNGGVIWQPVAVSYPNNLYSIRILNAAHAWAVGSDGLILHSVDPGITWQKQNGTASRPALVLRTSNGGATWTNTPNPLAHIWFGDIWRRIQFVTPDIGYLSASGIDPEGLYKTTDGGSTWKRTIFNDDRGMFPYYRYITVLRFYDKDLGIAALDNQRVGRTKDGGASWKQFNLPGLSWGNDIEFVPDNPANVWLSDLDNLYFSADTGVTWKQVMGVASGRDIVLADSLHGWLLTDDDVLHTDNGTMVGTEQPENALKDFSLAGNFPNPFSASTSIRYTIAAAAHVTLKVYSLLGKEITTLVSELQGPGSYVAVWKNPRVPAGAYFSMLNVNGATAVGRLVVK